MDDLLFVSYETDHRTRYLITLLHDMFTAFGIEVSPDKSIFEPTTLCEFLGYMVSVAGTITLTKQHFQWLVGDASSLLA